jgi:hypothetical protein
LNWSATKKIADDLIAEVTFHGKGAEPKTGGDFGLVISRPQISNKLIVEHFRGLLCQAKRWVSNGSKGALTENQIKLFDGISKYLAFVLYSLPDNTGALDAFIWKSCKGFEVEAVKRWLKDGVFPDSYGSDEIIKQLGRDQIGTCDERIIREKIAPLGNPALQIRIWWPEDDPDFKSRILQEALRKQALPIGQRVYINRLS